ncbi:uncharacterized protein MKZ38_002052 [Zalerion maritima]|uniref:Phosphoglycerate mutase n=1 Tax=Zalerion maritima TaxID=339359 RepID=A0AAD5RZE2_9PEZI|nr:uncharacterized protein MKZ38_002052 [Zalerion maritima]
MGRPPMCLCVVRHGNRLDAADKRWHLSSPTPYDPPLTYGGWLQSRALGVRIGDVLRQEIEERERVEAATNPPTPKKRKRYQVVIHSSPFLRCIQTSIAVSAGLAQNPLPVPESRPSNNSSCQKPENVQPEHRNSNCEPPTLLTNFANQPAQSLPSFQKSILRLDACFGEWLSPEYFEMITPPPSSVMMLGTAKAELLRHEDYKNLPHFHFHTNSSSTTHHLWSSPYMSAQEQGSSPFEDFSPLDAALPPGEDSQDSPRKSVTFASPLGNVEPIGYVPPTLSYSTSNNGQIPPGVIAHAKDETLDFDYQWDSMREPLNWGDGGSFGEEWTAMHKRFRRGLKSLVDWYTTAEDPTHMVTKTVRMSEENSSDCAVDEDDEESDTFVVIVSHGAGCNALIGAITRKPVLMDVGLASLTLAIRQDGVPIGKREGDGIVPVHEIYDIKIFANTDHTRSSTSTTPSQSRSPSMANLLNGNRGRFASNSVSSSAGNFSFIDSQSGSRSSSASAALASCRRNGNQSSSIPRTPSISNGSGVGGITVGSGVTSFVQPTIIPSGLSRSPSVGLWSPFRTSREDDVNSDDGDSMVLNFSLETSSPDLKAKTRPSPLSNMTTHTEEANEANEAHETNSEAATSGTEPDFGDLPEQCELSLGAGVGGLWGAAPAPPPEERPPLVRDMSFHKRRWTVNERTT